MGSDEDELATNTVFDIDLPPICGIRCDPGDAVVDQPKRQQREKSRSADPPLSHGIRWKARQGLLPGR